MKFDRRQFIVSLAAAGGCTALRPCRSAELKVGILSDVHIKEPENTCASVLSTSYWGDGSGEGMPTSVETYRRALEYFRDRGADAVMISGDFTDLGVESQFKAFADTWNEVFPSDRRPDGGKVEKIFVSGNHEWQGWMYNCVKRAYPDEAHRKRISFNFDHERMWKRYIGEDYESIFMKDVKGYKFIGAHWVDRTGVPALPEAFARFAPSLPKDKPFFYVQHLHPKGTCSGGIASCDSGISTKVLSAYPNAVAFSGHSHRSLVDERTVWQGAFTSVGCSSLRFVQTPSGWDNGNDYVDIETKLLPPLNAYRGRQGMFMSVFDDSIRLERREFFHGRSLADDWVIPLGTSSRPYAPAFRTAAEKAPQFPRGAAARAERSVGRDRNGARRDLVSVTFPAALPAPGSPRVCDYEVAAYAGQRLLAAKCVVSEGSFMDEACDKGLVRCLFAAQDLPSSAVRFEISPRGFFGAKGAKLTVES